MRKFTKSERSSWPYFWAHWCAFQMVAINLRIWKPRYLFHDWYKPWLKMFGINYKRIQRIHRYNSKHHIEWFDDYYENTQKHYEDFDLDALIIDWECSQYTKESCPENAREKMESVLKNTKNEWLYRFLNTNMRNRLNNIGL